MKAKDITKVYRLYHKNGDWWHSGGASTNAGLYLSKSAIKRLIKYYGYDPEDCVIVEYDLIEVKREQYDEKSD